jgi:hypothetical protein
VKEETSGCGAGQCGRMLEDVALKHLVYKDYIYKVKKLDTKTLKLKVQ